MSLDINTYSFSASTHGNQVGVLILLGFSIAYWAINMNMLPVYMNLMDTLSKTKPLTICTIIYILIAQKIVRVFIVKEKQLLEQFLENARNNITTLGDFYDVKSSGYTSQEHKKKQFHKVSYRNGTEDFFVKFVRGSITSEFANTRTTQVKVLCNFMNTLMSQEIVPRIVISDERIERSQTFKFFQHKLKEGDFHPDFIDLCNSTILYHEYNAEQYSRITSTYFLVPGKTAKQKIFLDTFMRNLDNTIKHTPFRSVILMNKNQILNMFKDLNALNSINETDLQTDEAGKRVKLGNTALVMVKDILTGEILLNEDVTRPIKIDISGIEYQLLTKTGGGQNLISNNKANVESTVSSLDLDEFESVDDVVASQDLPELDDLPDDLPEISDYEDVTLDTIMTTADPLSEINKHLGQIKLSNGVLDFKSVTEGKSDIEKSVILINNIRNNKCDTIIL